MSPKACRDLLHLTEGKYQKVKVVRSQHFSDSYYNYNVRLLVNNVEITSIEVQYESDVPFSIIINKDDRVEYEIVPVNTKRQDGAFGYSNPIVFKLTFTVLRRQP
jgi:hypothetical protein